MPFNFGDWNVGGPVDDATGAAKRIRQCLEDAYGNLPAANDWIKLQETADWALCIIKGYDAERLISGDASAGSGGGPGSNPLVETLACLASVSVSDCVYFSANDTVDTCDPTVIAKMPANGIVISKPTTTTANVLYLGPVTGLSGLVANQIVFVGNSGQPSLIEPTTGDRVVQVIGRARSTTALVFRPEIMDAFG